MKPPTLVNALFSKPISNWTPITKGNTPALCGIVHFAPRDTVFVKVATNAQTAEWLKKEHQVYQALPQAPYRPTVLAWHESPTPALALTDLSDHHWPPPWSDQHVATVLDTLSKISSLNMINLPSIDDDIANGWHTIDAHRLPFLQLGLVTVDWLNACLPALQAAAHQTSPRGRHLLHFDVRSDNLCIRDGVACLVDWNHACLGAANMDVAFWLPSLRVEGGPPPEAILGDAPTLAAIVSGFYACRAGLPHIPQAPKVRILQQRLLRAALPWAIRALSLPPADGPSAASLIE